MNAPAPPSRGALGVLFLTVFLDLLGFGLVIPILPLYAKHLALAPAMIGPLFASYSTMQFLFAPMWGMLSDRVGRRPVLLVSVFGSMVAHGLMASAHGPALLFVARSFAGLCGANLSAAQAYIADVTSERDRARGMGLIGAAFGIGFVLGPAIAGIVSKFYGIAAPFWFASGLAAVNLISAALLLPEPPHAVRAQAPRPRLAAIVSALRTPELAPLLLIFFLVTFAFAKLESTFSLWLAEPPFRYDEAHVGYVFTYIGVLLILVQGVLVGRLARRFGEARLIKVATALLAAGIALLPIAHSVPVLLLVILPITFGNGLNNPSTSALISRLSPPDRQGEVLGVAQSMSSLGRIFGPPTGTFLFAHVSKNAPYLVGGAIMATACLLALARVRTAKRGAPGEDARVRL
ncbi:MAG TPA: MFS transporter [Polyangia bacterium]|nr:MFS transporter [Polyangia bacterium]